MTNISILIITLSDRAAQGAYKDVSGSDLESILKEYLTGKNIACITERKVIPDEASLLQELVQESILNKTDFIFTTGGTGIGPRDITPDVIRPLLTKEIPGIMEVIHVKYGLQFPAAALSRSLAGIADQSLVYCLPGNPKAVKEYMEEILKTLLHCYKILHGVDDHK